MIHQMRAFVERIPHHEIESLELIATMIERESPDNALTELLQGLGTMVHLTVLLWRGAHMILESLASNDPVQIDLWKNATIQSLNQMGALFKERSIQSLRSIGTKESDRYDAFEMFGLYAIVPKNEEGTDDRGEGAGHKA